MPWLPIFNNMVNTELVSTVEVINGDARLAAVLHMAGGNRVQVNLNDWPAVQKALDLPAGSSVEPAPKKASASTERPSRKPAHGDYPR
jgi:hypothetical protein